MAVTLLGREQTALAIVDFQEKLVPIMAQSQRTVNNAVALIRLSRLFQLPVILTEQFPRWLGSTIPEIKESLPAYDPIPKMEFNCCEVEGFNKRIETENVRNIVLIGIESHICVFQTCFSLLAQRYIVHVPRDAVDSRQEENRRVGLDLMKETGAIITSTEAVIYQILKKAGTSEFKEMMKIIR
jgi:nicotinamidase-related amidase